MAHTIIKGAKHTHITRRPRFRCDYQSMWPREQLVETDVKDTVMLNLTIVTAVIILIIVIFIEELVTLTRSI